MSVNTTVITAVGRVVSEVTTRVIPTGAKVANFRIACQERVFDKAQEKWVDGDRMYMRVACWRKLADNVTDCLRMGDQVMVKGRLRIRDYEPEEGDRRAVAEIDAWSVGPDLALHSVAVNRPDWAVSPNQQRLLDPLVQLAKDDPAEANLVEEDAAQAA
jgi:single-strand DNA-binding protein